MDRQSHGIDVIYGVTPDFALNRMDDIDRPELYIMTEDIEATVLASALLRSSGVDLTRISFVEVGPANIVAAVSIAARSPRFPVKAIGIIDGDQQTQQGVLKFPGKACPEKQLFEDLHAKGLMPLATRLDLSVSSVQTAFARAMSAIDPHDWPYDLARYTGQTFAYLWETVCQVWVKNCLTQEDVKKFSSSIQNLLS